MPVPVLHVPDPGDSEPNRVGPLRVVEVVAAADVARGPQLPLILARVAAGFPSPADDYVESNLDLHELTGAGAAHCYFLRVEGESMVGAGIFDGDVLVVDRAMEAVTGAVVVASIDGELTVKRFVRRMHEGCERVMLLAENDAYPAIEVGEEQDLVIWGVVSYVLHDLRVRAGGRAMRTVRSGGPRGGASGDGQ